MKTRRCKNSGEERKREGKQDGGAKNENVRKCKKGR